VALLSSPSILGESGPWSRANNTSEHAQKSRKSFIFFSIFFCLLEAGVNADCLSDAGKAVLAEALGEAALDVLRQAGSCARGEERDGGGVFESIGEARCAAGAACARAQRPPP